MHRWLLLMRLLLFPLQDRTGIGRGTMGGGAHGDVGGRGKEGAAARTERLPHATRQLDTSRLRCIDELRDVVPRQLGAGRQEDMRGSPEVCQPGKRGQCSCRVC